MKILYKYVFYNKDEDGCTCIENIKYSFANYRGKTILNKLYKYHSQYVEIYYQCVPDWYKNSLQLEEFDFYKYNTFDEWLADIKVFCNDFTGYSRKKVLKSLRKVDKLN